MKTKDSVRTRGIEATSVLSFALGIFLLIALGSYHFQDPVLFSSAQGLVHNLFGRTGAWVSNSLLSVFGLSAFLLPLLFTYLSVLVLKEGNGARLSGSLSAYWVGSIAFSAFLSLQWKYWAFGGPGARGSEGLILTGGIFGTWVASTMMKVLNYWGATLMSLLVLVLAVVTSTPLKLTAVVGRFFQQFFLPVVVPAVSAALVTVVWGMAVGVYRAGRWIFTGITFFGQALGREVFEALQLAWRPKPIKRVPQKPVDVLKKPILERESPESSAELAGPVAPNLNLWAEDAFLDEPAESLIQESSDENVLSAPRLASSPAKPSAGIAILPREVSEAVATKSEVSKIQRAALKSSRGNWKLPTIEFLKNPPAVHSTVDRDRLISNSQILKQKFADFGIDGEVTAVRPGPVITLYEFKPGPGVKVSRIAALADDLSMALSAQSVRILAPLPGKSVVGIEIPSDVRETVYLREFLQHPDFYGVKHNIPVVMGKDIGGQTYLSDLARMPHLLCAGQTGSGKSVFMNGLICSLFYRFTPDELRMILVDPKFIEFRAYQDIPHLLLPVVDDPKQASIALRWAVREMERRYRILAKMGARNLATFNQKVDEMGADVVRDLLFAEDQSEQPAMTGGDWIEAFEPDESGAPRVSKLPYIVIVIDELADLMMIAKKEVEISIARIAQKARAAGIHLIIATQRPSTDVVTGLIKANLPSRVSFQLASYVDSKTILDRAGAERLLGQGDMLFIPPGVSQSIRLHGAYLEDDEIHKITAFLKSQGKPAYRDEILLSDDEDSEDGDDSDSEDDALFGDGVELVKRSGHASASFLQRHLKIGYNRAARMIETMESRGIVGPQDGARPRAIL